ncbi:hypothetical protein CEXT_320021 [Caerostris extrusa]|uniref:C2H2-type domain-containing protein n=1 Tax=Caerostris extrusa TaxID=172846 RepID=A0AAV4YAQ6_CAEEX|nr:hypothetical protein CEXT_320021 [Caerostris extrusa]
MCGMCTALRHHTTTHSGERPFACSECSKRYVRRRDLKRHMLKHAGEEKGNAILAEQNSPLRTLLKLTSAGRINELFSIEFLPGKSCR